MRAILRSKNGVAYLLGQTISAFGDSALWLVAAIWIVQLTGSIALAGLSFFFLSAPSVLAPFAGLLIDRVPRRPLLVVANLASAAVVLMLLAVHGRGDVWLIYIVMTLYGVSNVVLGSAQSTLLPSVLAPEHLGSMNALLRSAREALRLVAPPIGAAIFVIFGASAVAIADAATFGAATIALLVLRISRTEHDPAPKQHIVHELAAGFRHILSSPTLRRTVTALAAVLLVVGLLETATLALITHGLHRPAAFVGIVQAVQGAGAIVGGLAAIRALPRLGETSLAGLGAVGIGGGCALWTFPATLPSVLGGAALLGAGLPWLLIGIETLVQLRTPDAILGRTFAAIELTGSLQTISIAVGAAVIAVVPFGALIALAAVVTGTTGAWLFLSRGQTRDGAGQEAT